MALPKPFYEDGSVTIYHGDCRELLPHIEADVLVTDPPYGITHTQGGFNGARTGRSILNDESTEVRDDLLNAWGSGPALVFGSPLLPPSRTRQVLVWQKGPAAGLIGAAWGWRRDWEAIFVLGDWPARTDHKSSVFTFPAARHEAKVYGHSHTKPFSLMLSLIERCPVGVVFDPFMGSGTTVKAAKDSGRKAIGIELEERYCQIAAERCSQEVFDFS